MRESIVLAATHVLPGDLHHKQKGTSPVMVVYMINIHISFYFPITVDIHFLVLVVGVQHSAYVKMFTFLT